MDFALEVSKAWGVFLLFLIPIGGGIPAGVLLAQKHAIHWSEMMLLYFFSDVVLACFLEPLILFLILVGRKSSTVLKAFQAVKSSIQKTASSYGTNLGPLALVMVAFGVDPMTGRAAAAAAGHGFVTGWLIAISGDMIYFTLIMVSTLWLRETLGDGTAATLVILVLMMIVPGVVRRFRRPSRPS